jgi:hypothetical protein
MQVVFRLAVDVGFPLSVLWYLMSQGEWRSSSLAECIVLEVALRNDSSDP